MAFVSGTFSGSGPGVPLSGVVKFGLGSQAAEGGVGAVGRIVEASPRIACPKAPIGRVYEMFDSVNIVSGRGSVAASFA